MKLVFLLMVVCLFCLSCTKEIEMPFPDTEPQIVLNGILHPDSIVHVYLTKTLPLKSTQTTYPIIENAKVLLFENEELIGKLIFKDSLYRLDYKPKPGHRYTIEAEVPGYTTVRASDIIPSPPTVEICYREDTAKLYQFSSAILNIAIDDPAQEANFYWLDVVSTSPKGPRCRFKEDSIVWDQGKPQYIKQDTIVCNDSGPPTFEKYRSYYYESFSPVPDRFNAFVDNTSGGVTVYEGYLRVEDAALNGEVILFDINGGRYDYLTRYRRIHDQLAVTLTVTNASQHYDRYMKSSITYMLNRSLYSDEDITFKPFVQINPTYSNVENGTGIFAACNSISLEIGDFLCK